MSESLNPLASFQEMGTLPKVLLLLGFVFLSTALFRGASFSDRLLPASLAFISLSLTVHYFSGIRSTVSDGQHSATVTHTGKMWSGIGMSVTTCALIVWFVLIPSPKTATVPNVSNDSPKASDVTKPSNKQNDALPIAPVSAKPTGEDNKTSRNNTPSGGTITQAKGEKSTAVGPVTQGPCSILQAGGSNNQAQGGNCAPPLTLTPSLTVVPSDQEGFIKTIIRVVPNVDVATTGSVVMKFDNPVKSVGFWIEGEASVMGGGRSVPSGTDPVVTIASGFNPKHPLLLTVYSALPVKLLEIHLE